MNTKEEILAAFKADIEKIAEHVQTHSRLKAWPGSTNVIADPIAAVEKSGAKLYYRMCDATIAYIPYREQVKLVDMIQASRERLTQFLETHMPRHEAGSYWNGSVQDVIGKAISRKD